MFTVDELINRLAAWARTRSGRLALTVLCLAAIAVVVAIPLRRSPGSPPKNAAPVAAATPVTPITHPLPALAVTTTTVSLFPLDTDPPDTGVDGLQSLTTTVPTTTTTVAPPTTPAPPRTTPSTAAPVTTPPPTPTTAAPPSTGPPDTGIAVPVG